MQIELIGCTGAGKSSLSQQIIQQRQQNGVQVLTSYDFVLNWAHFGWLKNHKARMAVLNAVALIACLLAWPRNRAFYRFVAGAIRRLPSSVSPAEKLKIARIAARNAGIYEIVRRGCKPNQIVLADEGTLHIANYLFVHVTHEPNIKDLNAFLNLVSLPDAAVYLRQSTSVLVERTMRRGHKRIPGGSPVMASSFIRHSLEVFEHIASDPTIGERLLIFCNGDIVTPGAGPEPEPHLALAREIFKAPAAQA